jgi:hypothetical protein
MESGNLNFLEPSGPLQACNGTALPFISLLINGQNLQQYEHLCTVFLLATLTINLSVILFRHDISSSIPAPISLRTFNSSLAASVGVLFGRECI